MSQANINVALVGNPNSGKTSLFNALTGLNQKVGNFPGVTVDRKTGTTTISSTQKATVIDLPGTYSLYPKSMDEYVAYESLLSTQNKYKPDVIVVVADATMLQRNLLFCTQIIDLQKPVVLALTMVDLAEQAGAKINTKAISDFLNVPVIPINPRTGKGIKELKGQIEKVKAEFNKNRDPFVSFDVDGAFLSEIKKITGSESDYAALHMASATEPLKFLSAEQDAAIKLAVANHKFSKARFQAQEIMDRFQKIEANKAAFDISLAAEQQQNFSKKIDKVLLHRFWGNLILLVVLLLMFQAIFWLATYPMDWIEAFFGNTGSWLSANLPEQWWSDLIVNGLWAGLGGIVIFVPQIAILFGIITILEDTGYMARVTFLTDKLLKSVGMNGKASMPMISGLACAIPAVMATRIIENKKERLIAIMVTPLMSCSARLPVYIILISLVIPNTTILGVLSLQGLVMLGLYFLGFVMALIVAKVMDWLIKGERSQLFLMELPVYRAPRWKNALHTMIEKAKIFVVDAGKVIMIISIILWALAKFGPDSRMDAVEQKYAQLASSSEGNVLSKQQEFEKENEHLENSYIGIMGKAIEPVIHPLGYDWKIGIALITSFAAREAYVGTIATLYSMGGDVDEDDNTLKGKMAAAQWPDGRPVYTLASGLSLLVFYVFAMQCMSTLAIVKRETKSWKWPLVQVIYMGALAYLCAFITYHIFK
jgi:ferrous iron transport protein B